MADKSLGQHWLYHKAALHSIVAAAQLTDEDKVLEIGPGHGTLTGQLVKAAGRVIAVEFDPALAASLASKVPSDRLHIVEADIKKFDLGSLPAGYKVVANIPYYLTSHLFRLLSESQNPPSSAVLLVQKEVAQRVAAAPGGMSLLSVSTQLYNEVALGDIVPAKLFSPPPKVDSQVLILQRRTKPLFPKLDHKKFFQIVRAGFSGRRKTLRNALSGGLQLDKSAVMQWCHASGVNPESRAQELSLEQWHQLYQHLPSS